MSDHLLLLIEHKDGQARREPVHAERLPSGNYRLLSSPGFVQGIAAGDEFRVLDEDGTFEVTFVYGTPPPPAGREAAADLACELLKGWTGGECNLPRRLTSITRQGVTMALLDPFQFLNEGKVGVYTVDLFLKTYNPGGLHRRAAVMSPDIRRSNRRVDT